MILGIPKESAEGKFLRENPGYEIYYSPSVSQIGGYDIRMSKGDAYFTHFIGFNDMINVENLTDMFEKIFELGKCKIEEMITERNKEK